MVVTSGQPSRGVEPGQDGEDEVPEGRVLSRVVAYRVTVCVLKNRAVFLFMISYLKLSMFIGKALFKVSF